MIIHTQKCPKYFHIYKGVIGPWLKHSALYLTENKQHHATHGKYLEEAKIKWELSQRTGTFLFQKVYQDL